MAHKKAGGSTKNLRDSKPKYLGVKLGDGAEAKPGAILVRQRGSKIIAGNNVKMGRDHTLFATSEGTVSYKNKRKSNFDGSHKTVKIAEVK